MNQGYVGAFGMMVRVEAPTLNAAQEDELRSYVLYLPEQAAWSYYLLLVAHLRSGNLPVAFDGALHHMMLLALTPGRRPNPRDRATIGAILPVNWGRQFGGLQDQEAVWLCQTLARALCDGKMGANPDQHPARTQQFDAVVLNLISGLIARRKARADRTKRPAPATPRCPICLGLAHHEGENCTGMAA